MAVTFDSIATATLGSAASSISITGIPGTYTDLKAYFVYKSSGNAGTNNIPVLYMNSTTSNWSTNYMSSGTTTKTGGTNTGKSGIWAGAGSYTAGSTHWFFVEFNIMDYASATRLELTDMRISGAQTGGANQESTIANGINTTGIGAAVTSLTITDAIFGNNYAAGTTLSLFGITRA